MGGTVIVRALSVRCNAARFPVRRNFLAPTLPRRLNLTDDQTVQGSLHIRNGGQVVPPFGTG